MNGLAILKGARARIADPKRWATGWYAFDNKGDPCDAQAENAHCWCAYGALRAERGGIGPDEAELALNRAQRRLYPEMYDAADVNDDQEYGHPAVLKIFDAAIADLETA